jgi:hypothetical protein
MLLRDPFRTSLSSSPSPSSSPPAAIQAWCTMIVQTVGLLVRSTATTMMMMNTDTTNNSTGHGTSKSKARARTQASPSLRANQETKRKTGSLGMLYHHHHHPPYQSMCRVISQLTRATVYNHHNTWSWQGGLD